ncbi:PKD domain-containing protein [Limnochorda pilosa]|uniref:PKD domain-containing protein n=1 Tax=Limnochorda pilosa TaxID=1555112 RepID=A0A0K2SNJ6_LIMPI|nr:PKD domain-containing protein [Limnochorda pilosa]BAS28675.1 hypothetical protein LIP_2846 [Limnochorda pilosa]
MPFSCCARSPRPAAVLLFAATLLANPASAQARWARTVVISEVYGGGGNRGATYTHDFIELYNPTAEPVSLEGWSVQYAAASGAFSATKLTSLEGSIPAFGSFLIEGAAGSAGDGAPLPSADVEGSLSLAADSGQVALARSAEPVTGLDDPNLVDLVGYGAASVFEGEEPAPRGSNARSLQRRADGGAEPGSGTGSGWDTDQNGQDFVAASPTPRTRRDPPEPPAPPVAVIGAPHVVPPGTQVDLDGSGSWDPGGDPLAYRWRLVEVPAGSVAILEDPTAPRAAFVADRAGTYLVELTVSDGLRESAPARAEAVASEVPIAEAGEDQLVPAGATVRLDGSKSRDPSGARLSYRWSLVDLPQGSGATLAEPERVDPAFTADLPGDYRVRLVVTNRAGLTATDELQVHAAPLPEASFSFEPAEAITPETEVRFSDGSRSAERPLVAWHWRFGDGAESRAQNPVHRYAAAGRYVVELQATDDLGGESPPTQLALQVRPAGSGSLVTHGPNPAREQVAFFYRGEEAATLLVYDVSGRLVHQAQLDPGPSEHGWDLTTGGGRPVAPGLYLYVVVRVGGGRSPVERLVVER